MEELIYYKGHYIQRQLVKYNIDEYGIGYTTTLPEEAVPPAARLRGFLTVASAKKYITRYGKRPKIERVL